MNDNKTIAPASVPQPAAQAPIDMILHCPACGLQHIDTPEAQDGPLCAADLAQPWTNPPHRSHLCHGCEHIWRPADVPTNGVASIRTKGKNDTFPALRVRAVGIVAPMNPDAGMRCTYCCAKAGEPHADGCPEVLP